MSSDIPRVFVLGIDGATWELLDPWIVEGRLPNLGRLKKEGAWGPLASVMPPITAPAWTSFYTGTNPGKHGLFDLLRREGYYGVVPVNASERRDPSLFRLLSDAGKRVGVINAPVTYPPEPVNGYLVCGFMTPPDARDYTEPRGFAEELQHVVPDYTVWPMETSHPRGREQGLVEAAPRLVSMGTSAFEYMVRRLGEWEFLMLQVQITDTLQHVLWRFCDPHHPEHEAGAPEVVRNGILTCFQTIDSWLGRFLAQQDGQFVTIVLSDHGFGPLYGYVHVNAWLAANGWLRFRRTPVTSLKRALYGLGITPVNAYRAAFRLGFGRQAARTIRQRKGLVLRAVDTLFLSFADVDWARTKAYSLGNVGPIYINLKGREPAGTVEPGAEYERTVEAIVQRLRDLRHPRTGEPLVERVYLRDEMYQGPAASLGPDIMFLAKDGLYEAYGDVQFASSRWLAPPHDGWSGTHRQDGVLIMHGPNVQAGLCLENASIVDLAPTILGLLGVPIPRHMDGRILHEAFRPGALDANALEYVDMVPAVDVSEYEYSEEEAEQIRRRLSDLGYLE